jgi:hypothetical protein
MVVLVCCQADVWELIDFGDAKELLFLISFDAPGFRSIGNNGGDEPT